MASINIREAKKTDAKKIYELMQQQAAEQNTVLPPHLTYEGMTVQQLRLCIYLSINLYLWNLITSGNYSQWGGHVKKASIFSCSIILSLRDQIHVCYLSL